MTDSKEFFEAGKTYIENDPYRAPEITGVFKVEWVGTSPDQTSFHVAMGFTTEAYPGEKWKIFLSSATRDSLDNGTADFNKWVEAVWDDSQTDHYWRAKTPEELRG